MSEWHTHSIFLEVKPRAELASLFVDCPPEDFENGNLDTKKDENNEENEPLNLVRVSEHGVEIGIPHEVAQSLRMHQKLPRYRASISNLILYPQTLCATSWADNHRLFMCKLHVEADGLPIVPKTFHRLANDISDTRALQQYCKDAVGASISLTCSQCGRPIVETKNATLVCMPSDDWLETSQSADFYCRDSCGAGCDPERHRKTRDGMESGQMHSDWFPTPKRYLVSHSYLAANKESLSEPSICHDDRLLMCNGCHAELGTVVKNCSQIVLFHHAVCTLTMNSKPFLKARFPDTSVFFAHLVLSSCEAQSSLKLVVRSLNRTPHVLIWLLDSYVVAASGELHVEEGEQATTDEIRPFPAVKMLYKVFDAQSAANDPRANGEDASVGLIDVPLGCCMQLIEHLLLSSHSLPLPCRSVGQFYVGFLKIAESV